MSELKVTRFERVSGLLLASIAVVFFLVACLFFVWLNGPKEVVADSSGKPLNPIPQEWDSPEVFDVVLDLPDIDLENKQSFEDEVKSIPSLTDQLSKTNAGGFTGDDRTNQRSGPGPGDPTATIPPHKRWVIRYEPKNIDEYATQLESLGTEIGAVDLESDSITRISRLTDKQPFTTKSSRQIENDRDQIFFAHSSKRLKKWDLVLLRKAGLGSDYGIVHFLSNETAAKLGQIELKYLDSQNISLESVRTTEFKFVQDQASNKWQVIVAQVTKADKN